MGKLHRVRHDCGGIILKIAHGEAPWYLYLPHEGVDDEGGGTNTYMLSFPRVLKAVKCLMPGCLAVVHSAGCLQEHFMYRHF